MNMPEVTETNRSAAGLTEQSPVLFGADETPRIVAIERVGESNVRVYRRDTDAVSCDEDRLQPWLVASEDALRVIDPPEASEVLSGSGVLNRRFRFHTWSAYMAAHRALRDASIAAISMPSPIEQYLVDTGRGLFRGMTLDRLVRVQLDIETLSLDARGPDARIVLITASINGSNPVVFRGDELSESEMIRALNDWIQRHDPDIIEGHNLFNFDLPYLMERAREHNVALIWGRDGSPVRLGSEQRFKAGARTIPYQSAYVYGRHIVDTYQQIQRYDTAGQLESYALKAAITALGLERSDRTHIEGAAIAGTWETDRAALIRYATDDVFDVNTLSELTLPTEFYQTTLLPRGLQSVATGGPGEKINDLLIRAYISQGESVPLPMPARDYPGGFAEIRNAGRFAPVVKCDVESLYPSIMLADRIRPAGDRLDVFIPMLSILTERRITAKRAEQVTQGGEQARWRGIQSSLKVLVNSFYGYLGYGRGYFNDYDAARAVTLRGQQIVQRIVTALEEGGATVIEIDTDGVLFRPPDDVCSEHDEVELITSIGESLGSGIRLAHDGRYRGMLSLRLKNYALLTYDGRVVLKGSSLRSRREEPFLRRFLRDAVAHLLEPEEHGDIRSYYLDTAQSIIEGRLRPEEFSRTETITDQTYTSDSTRRLAAAAQGERIGERIAVYERTDGALGRIEEYAGDEDRAYLLRRLRDMAERFRPLYPADGEFDYTFPQLTLRTDIAELRSTQQSTQLGLFPM
jgi:DNA polymerase, archaea type